jgi:hypothetical protein
MLRRRFVLAFCAAIVAVLVATVGCGGMAEGHIQFAIFADDQIGYAAWQATQTENPSSANLPQLRQNLLDIAAQHPSFAVINGDLVMAEQIDQGQALTTQLGAWQQYVQSLGVTQGLELLPVIGNHESNEYDTQLAVQYPSGDSLAAWDTWCTQNTYNARGGNGPTAAGANPDHLVRDESRITYSFTQNRIHITILNTDTLTDVLDPVSGKPLAGWIPINWARADIEAAQADPEVDSIIVIGHRPIEGPSYDDPAWGSTILDTVEHPLGSELAEVLHSNSKVRAYLAAHVHAYHAFRLDGGTGAWQIIVGNGGAQCDSAWQPEGGQFFGYAMVTIGVHRRTEVACYGRPVPAAPQLFYEDSPVAPTSATFRDSVVVYAGVP